MVDDKTFIFPDWDTIAEVIDGRYEEELLQEVYAQLGRLWVGGLRQQFGSEYQLVESNKFFLLSKADEQTAAEALRFLEQCLTRIHSGLPFVPECLGYGKWPVLCLEGDLFYRYLNDYCSEDEEASATVGGVFLNRGYGHFAMPDAELSRYSAVFVHELTHAILHICDLPVWLDEAIAVTVENHITRECPYELTRELIRRHRDYWTEQNIQTFWAGHSFWSPDDGQELSYHLARFLFAALYQGGTTDPSLVSDFVSQSKREDAGQEAAIRCLGIDFGEVLTHLLGDGKWAPDVDILASLLRKTEDSESDTSEYPHEEP